MLNKVDMQNEQKFQISAKAVNALAIIGFVALVGGGISLAVFGARFVPTAVSGLSSAAVSLSSVFVGNNEPKTDDTTATTTPATTEETATTTPAVATTTPAVATSTPTKPVTVTPSPGQQTVDVSQVGGTPALFGQADLVTTITANGYFTATSTTNLIATTTIPTNAAHVVVRFKIQNKGTNIAPAGWAFTANLPSGIKTYPSQQSLLPGERIEYELYFDRPASGSTPTVSISADVNNFVGESNEANNVAATTFIIQ